jgi:DNA-binding NtrC family response regulator
LSTPTCELSVDLEPSTIDIRDDRLQHLAAMTTRPVERVLVVEDSRALLRCLRDTLAETYRDVRACRSVCEAEIAVADWWPDLVLLDVVLPDGGAFDVLELLERRHPAPAVIAMSGSAEPAQSFLLATRGVRTYLAKPLRLDRLHAVIRQALEATPDLRPVLRQTVGHKPLAEVQDEVRAVMVDEALARSRGSRRGAARLLSMSRQLLQYILRQH